LYSEDGTSRFRRNVGTDLPEHKVFRSVGLVMEFCVARVVILDFTPSTQA